MSRVSFTSQPYMLGFEALDRLIERTAKAGADGYPPFNIEALDEDRYRITLAVAGFAENDLAVTVEDSQLAVRGRQEDDSEKRVFLHRGIAARQFERNFVLAEGVEVTGARLESGLLHVDLERRRIEPKVQTVKITSAG